MPSTSLPARRQFQARIPQISLEVLEGRRLLSGSIVTPADTSASPVAALTIDASAGKRFKDVVGTWTTTDGLPARGSGTVALALINWGDGKSSHGKLVDDGSGVIQISGSHVWAKPGTFNTMVTVEEFPTHHAHQITTIGQGDGSVVVAPRPHAISIKGNITGTYTTPLGNPDARSYDFTGTGTAGVMGAVDLTGSITPPGFIRTAPATGELTLTTDPSASVSGSVTIDVTGHTQPGGSPLPQKLAYVITGGTGAFANTAGKGTIAISLVDTAGTFVFVIH